MVRGLRAFGAGGKGAGGRSPVTGHERTWKSQGSEFERQLNTK